MLKRYTKEEAIRIISEAAKEYSRNLANRNFLIIYKNRENHKIEFFETVFLPRNFQHLTGIVLIDEEGKKVKNSVQFYNKCCDKTLKKEEIEFKEDGTSPLKLDALPRIVSFFNSSKMTTIPNTQHPYLQVDRYVGNINYSLGFFKEGNYYIPNTCLLQDVREFGTTPSQILAVLSKSSNKNTPLYDEIKYTAKGFTLDKEKLSKEILEIIDI